MYNPLGPTTALNPLPTRDASGIAGAICETGTTAVTGRNFSCIQCIEATVFAAFTSSTISGDVMTGITFPAGFVIYGAITDFTLTSGKVIAYTAA